MKEREVIVSVVAEYFGFTSRTLRERIKKQKAVLARNLAAYFLIESGYNSRQAGFSLGGRQPIFASLAHKRILARLSSDEELNRQVAEIKKRL